MSFNTEDLFNKLQKQEQEAANNPSLNTNTTILKLKPNNNYSLRLLWLPPYGTCKREYPMINQYIHNYWDEQATAGQRGHMVYCPTTQYIKGETRAGFDACPICAECSKLYKQSQEGSSSATKLYKTFRRTFRGFVPVYVVNGPDDVVNQIKILQYGKQIKDFFDRKIFGTLPKGNKSIEDTTPIDPDEVIGLEAFIYERDGQVVTNGFNLNIQVSTKRMSIEGKQIDMPAYTLDFSRRESNITSFGDKPITTEYFENINEEISYDNSFYLDSTAAELNTFVMKFIKPEAIISENTDTTVKSNKTLNPYSAKTETAKTEVKEQTPVVPTIKAAETSSSNKNDDDIDVEQLINDL